MTTMVTVITGKNAHSLQDALQTLSSKFTQKYSDSIERFDGTELTTADTVVNAVRSLSFLEPRKLVIVKDFSQSKELMDSIETIVTQTADTTDLILVDQHLDKRTAGYRYLQKNVTITDYKQLQDYEVEAWLITQAKQRGASLSPTHAKYLVSRVGNDQQRLLQEVIKLSIAGGEISKQHIDDLTESQPQSKVFDMLDALFQGKLETAWNLYKDQRAQGEDPHKIIAMITWQLSQLTIAIHAPLKTVNTLRSAGVSPYGAQKLLKMSQTISQSQLKEYVDELARIDAQIKTSADVESALELYFAFVSSK